MPAPPDQSLHHLPDIEPGLTGLVQPGPRSASFYQLAIGSLPQQAITYWVDTGSMAASYTLYDMAPSDRWLSGLRIARAFTAYQHFSLVKRVIRRVSTRTGMLLLPNLPGLYRDDDDPEHETAAMLGTVVQGLDAVAEGNDLPVLVSVSQRDDHGEAVLDAADQVIGCEDTRLGHRFTGDGGETTAYWDEGYWQTTIPYWVEICGAVGDAGVVATAEAFGIEGVA